ncbi:hypothetical protein FNF29_04917 [Cafeteria roenbergensis]|uniref:Uncharacterized protein n=1 Tax=Cafeteria roenbergensis TaxID=33653 RepID=A0A5A8CHX4_CAFRO|nr:hypothetical protein FNF29_04917 [Cafeteria roenbergensis]KAA0152653.1 hypothetical protein FNF31_06595 [Cafeteria roenbergensis]KAA0158152.1 hypothetical protein FNF28_06392 [Cafeteria roenbergensis]|eukprot:KAA0151028.1 hypothetical protein FNF29_04917 [Cafeteria roenbergensis]
MASGSKAMDAATELLGANSTDWSLLPTLTEPAIRAIIRAVELASASDNSIILLEPQRNCRLILQLAAIPSTADHGTIAAASELVKILSTRLPPDIAQLPNVAWTAMSAELLAELRPWLAIKADAAASGTALPAELSKQAEAVAAQVAARARLLLRPPAPAGGSDVRLAPLYRYADCDDLPAGVELADPLLTPGMVPPLSSRATHFAPSGEWLASEEAERVWWARQERRANQDAAAAAAAEAGTAVVSGEYHVTSTLTATAPAAAAAAAGGGTGRPHPADARHSGSAAGRP